MAKNLNRQSYQYSHPCRLPQNNGGKSVPDYFLNTNAVKMDPYTMLNYWRVRYPRDAFNTPIGHPSNYPCSYAGQFYPKLYQKNGLQAGNVGAILGLGRFQIKPVVCQKNVNGQVVPVQCTNYYNYYRGNPYRMN